MRDLRAVLLASASPRRRELLASLGLRVLVMPSNVDEWDPPGVPPDELASLHARSKADAVLPKLTGASVLVAADTVVDLDGASLGKPRDPSDAARMLRGLSGRWHVVHTAFVVIDGATRERLEERSTTRVHFAALGVDEIDAYVASGDPMDKAGAYGIQGRGAALVDRIEGDFYTVMGFPVGAFVRTLPQIGLCLPRDAEAVAAERGSATPMHGSPGTT